MAGAWLVSSTRSALAESATVTPPTSTAARRAQGSTRGGRG